MKFTQEPEFVRSFFESGRAKGLFDHIRNIGLSTGVFIAGNFLRLKFSPVANFPHFVFWMGWAFILLGGLLMLVCVIQGYFFLRKTVNSLLIVWAISVAYFLVAITFFLTLLRIQGIEW